MSETVSVSASSPLTLSKRKNLLLITWAIVLLLTVPEIILRAFLQIDTSWMLGARLALLAGLLALSFGWELLRPLRGFFVVMLVVYGVEGWFFGTFVSQSQPYQDAVSSSVYLAFFGERLLRIGAVLVMLVVLLSQGLKPRDFFLRVGNLRAIAEPSRWGIPRKPESWMIFGRNYAVIAVGILLFFLIPALQPSLNNFSIGLFLFAAICATMNAFAEEFLYRSALLPQLLPAFGKNTSIMVAAIWFGLAHYFGVPSGITGVLITAIGGWFFAKSMVETQGMGWPWFMHFVSDFAVYMVILLAGAL